MKTLSQQLLSITIRKKREEKHVSQKQLSEKTGINRSLISRIESSTFIPSIQQLQSLGQVLDFDITDMFLESSSEEEIEIDRSYKIAVAGSGYVGFSLAVLLAQHNDVTVVDIVEERIKKIEDFISPIQDDYIEQYLEEARTGSRVLNLKATTEAETAYREADYVIIAVPTNYDPKTQFFDCSAVESVLSLIKSSTESRENKPAIVIKSTIPVGYTKHIREKLGMDNIMFSPEFLRESKALYDNLYPSRIIVGHTDNIKEAAHIFAGLLQGGAIKENVTTLFMGTTEAEAVRVS